LKGANIKLLLSLWNCKSCKRHSVGAAMFYQLLQLI
jgi:hypothetical protein